MEQERQKREGEETDFQTPNMTTLCSNNCGFFGSSATNDLCSKCYKDLVLSKSMSVEWEKEDGGMAGKEVERTCLPSGSGTSSKGGEEEVGGAGAASAADVAAKNKKPSNRCSFCNKKVGLLGFKCRCNEVFCSVHRYSDKHNCPFDYKATGQEAIAKANPVVKADKVEKI